MAGMSTLGDSLRRLRENAGFTRENVANYLRVSVSTVCKIERGESRIAQEKLELLTRIYGVSTAALLGGKVSGQVSSYGLSGRKLTSGERNAVRALRSRSASYVSDARSGAER